MKTKTIEEINENKDWFFEKFNKIDKPLTRMIKKKEKTQITNSVNEIALSLFILKTSKGS